MTRVAIFVALVFLVLAFLRAARFLLQPRAGRRDAMTRGAESEMVRDPVCGTWIDRRLALSGIANGRTVAVCSERCLREVQSR